MSLTAIYGQNPAGSLSDWQQYSYPSGDALGTGSSFNDTMAFNAGQCTRAIYDWTSDCLSSAFDRTRRIWNAFTSKVTFPGAAGVEIKAPIKVEGNSILRNGCQVPSGDYLETCQETQITQIGNQCQLTTFCTGGDDSQYFNQLDFNIKEKLHLTNNKGVLQEKFTLTPGQIFAIHGAHPCGLPKTRAVGSEERDALKDFELLSSSTGGITSVCPKEFLDLVMDNIFAHISKNLRSGEEAEIAILLDTTGSMLSEINTVKSNIVDFVTKFETHKGGVLFASIFFRDLGDEYISRIATPFTSNAQDLLEGIQGAKADGGGDAKEALPDAFRQALRELLWRSSQRNIIVITDNPPKRKAQDGTTLEDIIKEIQEAETRVSIYPIKTYL